MIKNVILITIDSLRADHLSCLGYSKKTTPQLDRIAKHGVLFKQAISNGTSTPTSFRAILTSTYPLMYDDPRYLSSYRLTISEILKRGGYSTAAFHSNPFLSSIVGFNRGFDTFRENLDFKKEVFLDGINAEGMKRFFSPLLFRKELIKFKLKKLYKISKGEVFARANIINEMALSWLKEHPERFFIWLHYMDVHSPYIPPIEFRNFISFFSTVNALRVNIKFKQSKVKKSPEKISELDLKKLIDLYDAEIGYADMAVGALLTGLRKMDALDETLLIITSDHGEEFLEHGNIGHFSEEQLYDELLRVPLILYAPEIGENIIINEQVELLSIAPTIVDAIGLNTARDNFMGVSLLPLLTRGRAESKGVISETSKNKLSYREPGWKFICDKEHKKMELYDLHNDPNEKYNIADKEKEKAQEFKRQILQHLMNVEREKIRRKIRRLKTLERM